MSLFDFTRHATWELKATKAALSKLPLLNSADDNARLEAIKLELLKRKKPAKK